MPNLTESLSNSQREQLRKSFFFDGLPIEEASAVEELEGAKLYRGKAMLLRVACDVQALVAPDRLLFCARPKDDKWTFGTCFPAMPGAELTSRPAEMLLLSLMGLKNSTWVYVDSPGDNDHVSRDLGRLGTGLQFDAKRASPLTFHGSPDLEGLKPLTNSLAVGFFADSLANWLADSGFRVTGELSLEKDRRPWLRLYLPLMNECKFGPGSLSDAELVLSSRLFPSTEDAKIGIKGNISVEGLGTVQMNAEYPLRGDSILASVTLGGSPFGYEEALKEAQGLPVKLPPGTGAELLFSKSTKELRRASFAFDVGDEHELFNGLKLKSLRSRVTIHNPLGGNRVRSFFVSFNADTELGTSSPIEMLCGGSWPEGTLYLGLKEPGTLNLGDILGKLGLDPGGIPTFQVQDLVLMHNVKTGASSMRIDVGGDSGGDGDLGADSGFSYRKGDGATVILRRVVENGKGVWGYSAEFTLDDVDVKFGHLRDLRLLVERDLTGTGSQARPRASTAIDGLLVLENEEEGKKVEALSVRMKARKTGVSPDGKDPGWSFGGTAFNGNLRRLIPGAPFNLPDLGLPPVTVDYQTKTKACAVIVEHPITFQLDEWLPKDPVNVTKIVKAVEVSKLEYRRTGEGERAVLVEGKMGSLQTYVAAGKTASDTEWKKSFYIGKFNFSDLDVPFLDWFLDVEILKDEYKPDWLGSVWKGRFTVPDKFKGSKPPFIVKTKIKLDDSVLARLPLLGPVFKGEHELAYSEPFKYEIEFNPQLPDLKIFTVQKVKLKLEGALKTPTFTPTLEIDVPIPIPGMEDRLVFDVGTAIDIKAQEVSLSFDLKGRRRQGGGLEEFKPLDRKLPAVGVSGFHPFGLPGITLGALSLRYGKKGRAFKGWALIARASVDVEFVQDVDKVGVHFECKDLTLQNILDGFLSTESPALPTWLGGLGLERARLDWVRAPGNFTYPWPDGDRTYRPGLSGLVRFNLFGCRVAAMLDVDNCKFAGNMDEVELGSILRIKRAPIPNEWKESNSAFTEDPKKREELLKPKGGLGEAEREYMRLADGLKGPYIYCDFKKTPQFALNAQITLFDVFTSSSVILLNDSGFKCDFEGGLSLGPIQGSYQLYATLPGPAGGSLVKIGGGFSFGVEIGGFKLVKVSLAADVHCDFQKLEAGGSLRGEFTLLGIGFSFDIAANANLDLKKICDAAVEKAKEIGNAIVKFFEDVVKACKELAQAAARLCQEAAQAVVWLANKVAEFFEDLYAALRAVAEEIDSWFGGHARRDREEAARRRLKQAQAEKAEREAERDRKEREALVHLADGGVLDAAFRAIVEQRIAAYPEFSHTPESAANPFAQAPDWRSVGRSYYDDRWRTACHEAEERKKLREEFQQDLSAIDTRLAELQTRQSSLNGELTKALDELQKRREELNGAENNLKAREQQCDSAAAELTKAYTSYVKAQGANFKADAAKDVVRKEKEWANSESAVATKTFHDADELLKKAEEWFVTANNHAKEAADEVIARQEALLDARKQVAECQEQLDQVRRAMEEADPGYWYAARNQYGARTFAQWKQASDWNEAHKEATPAGQETSDGVGDGTKGQAAEQNLAVSTPEQNLKLERCTLDLLRAEPSVALALVDDRIRKLEERSLERTSVLEKAREGTRTRRQNVQDSEKAVNNARNELNEALAALVEARSAFEAEAVALNKIAEPAFLAAEMISEFERQRLAQNEPESPEPPKGLIVTVQ